MVRTSQKAVSHAAGATSSVGKRKMSSRGRVKTKRELERLEKRKNAKQETLTVPDNVNPAPRPLFTTVNESVQTAVAKVTAKRSGGKSVWSASPLWQRQEVWNSVRQTSLIESIFIGVPLGTIYLSSELEVVDGKQRLTALSKFRNDDFALQATGLERLPQLAGLKFSQLPERFQDCFDSYPLVITTLSDGDQELRFVLFHKVNTGGMPLRAMEVRAAVYHGNCMIMLRKLAKSEVFRKVVFTPSQLESAEKRMQDIELVARFFAFLEEGGENFKYNMNNFINTWLKGNQHINAAKQQEFTSRFEQSMKNCDILFPAGEAFRRYVKKSGRFKMAQTPHYSLFETIAPSLVGVSQVVMRANQEKLYNAYKKMIKDESVMEALGSQNANAQIVKELSVRWQEILTRLKIKTIVEED